MTRTAETPVYSGNGYRNRRKDRARAKAIRAARRLRP